MKRTAEQLHEQGLITDKALENIQRNRETTDKSIWDKRADHVTGINELRNGAMRK